MMTYGTTAEHLGAVALTMRANAQRNPRALTYGRPLTIEDYLRSPMVSDPYRKLDCCLESDGACAVVMVSGEAAAASAWGASRSPGSAPGRRRRR